MDIKYLLNGPPTKRNCDWVVAKYTILGLRFGVLEGECPCLRLWVPSSYSNSNPAANMIRLMVDIVAIVGTALGALSLFAELLLRLLHRLR